MKTTAADDRKRFSEGFMAEWHWDGLTRPSAVASLELQPHEARFDGGAPRMGLPSRKFPGFRPGTRCSRPWRFLRAAAVS